MADVIVQERLTVHHPPARPGVEVRSFILLEDGLGYWQFEDPDESAILWEGGRPTGNAHEVKGRPVQSVPEQEILEVLCRRLVLTVQERGQIEVL